MKNKILLPLLVLFFISAGIVLPAISWVEAQEKPTGSATVDQEEVKQSVKKRLEDSLNEKLEKVKGVLSNSDKWYAYVGEVVESDGQNTLKLKRQDKQKTINLKAQTTLVLTLKTGQTKTVTAEKIVTGWFALAMGKVDEQGVLQAQRIVFYEESPLSPVERKVVFGKISEIDNKKIVLKNHEELSLTLDKKTKLVVSGVKAPEVTDIAVGDKAIVVVQKNNQETLLKAIFVWPGSANPEAKDNQINATPSATASPSGKIRE